VPWIRSTSGGGEREKEGEERERERETERGREGGREGEAKKWMVQAERVERGRGGINRKG